MKCFGSRAGVHDAPHSELALRSSPWKNERSAWIFAAVALRARFRTIGCHGASSRACQNAARLAGTSPLACPRPAAVRRTACHREAGNRAERFIAASSCRVIAVVRVATGGACHDYRRANGFDWRRKRRGRAETDFPPSGAGRRLRTGQRRDVHIARVEVSVMCRVACVRRESGCTPRCASRRDSTSR
jgi:hypothetical protein